MNSFTRAARWNSRRYDRVLNVQLLKALLLEELLELYDAPEEVDALDAIADITFVAYGGIWKAGLSNEQVKACQDEAGALLDAMIKESQETGFPLVATNVIRTAIGTMTEANATLMCAIIAESVGLIAQHNFGLNTESFEKAMLVVCDSNDSKAIKKTDPSVKANIVKGEFFVAPEPRLQEILNARHN